MKPGGPLTRKTAMSRGAGIKSEPKPAKGPKLRKCAVRSCRTPFEPRSMTHKACSPDCAQIVAAAVSAAQRAKAARAEKAKDRAALEQLKSRNQLIAEAQTAFNLVVRLEDADLPCISCGVEDPPQRGLTGGAWDAGHYLSRGSSCHLRFDRRNVHKQCKGCNRPGGCTRDEHRRGVEARIGLEALEALEADQDSRDYTKDDLREIRDSSRRRAVQLKKERAP